MYRTVLVPLDGSSLGEHALPLALGLARRAGAAVKLVHVCAPDGPDVFDGELAPAARGDMRREQMRLRASAYLNQLAGSLAARWEVVIGATVLDGRAADVLYDHARAIDADLVVMTTHGYGPLARAWMGSVADKLVRRLPMPILLVRPPDGAQALDLLESVHEQVFEHMLIPLDGSRLAEAILAPAMAFGQLMGAHFTLMQAIEVPVLGYAPAAQAAGLDDQIMEQCRSEAKTYLEGAAEHLRACGLVVHTHVVVGPPALAIMSYAREQAIDMIALSTHGRGSLKRMLLGSVADKVVRGADVPVLIQRPGGAE